jgi:hypothetical protein
MSAARWAAWWNARSQSMTGWFRASIAPTGCHWTRTTTDRPRSSSSSDWSFGQASRYWGAVDAWPSSPDPPTLKNRTDGSASLRRYLSTSAARRSDRARLSPSPPVRLAQPITPTRRSSPFAVINGTTAPLSALRCSGSGRSSLGATRTSSFPVLLWAALAAARHCSGAAIAARGHPSPATGQCCAR